MELILYSKKLGNHIVYFDEEDYDLVSKYKWRLRVQKRCTYAITSIYLKEKQNNRSLFMHNLIMGEIGVDHRNNNGLDNRRKNLRKATQSQNSKNMRVSVLNKYGLKGVSFDKEKELYSVFITCNYKHIFLGYFNSLIKASDAYNDAASKYHGEFANLNIISDERKKELELMNLPKELISRTKRVCSSKGVSICNNRYNARITKKGLTVSLGWFGTESEASVAYQKAVKLNNIL